jgi:hypothetical protein
MTEQTVPDDMPPLVPSGTVSTEPWPSITAGTAAGLFLAIAINTGGLATRDSRPVYATEAEWRSLTSVVGVSPTLIPMNTQIMGAVPLEGQRGPDAIGAVLDLIARSNLALQDDGSLEVSQ